MKRLSLNTATTIFLAAFAIMLMTFIGLCNHVRQQQAAEQQAFDTKWDDMVDSNNRITVAGVTVSDSIEFQLLASEALIVDMPEEYPATGDSMCAYVRHDTIFVEYWHGHKEQIGRFVYRHNE